MLSVELWSRHEAPLPPGHLQNDSLVLERLLDGLCLSPFLLESVLFPVWTESSKKVLCGSCFFQFGKILHNPSLLVRLEYLQNAPWIARKWHKNLSLFLQYSILFFELPSKIFCNHTSSLKSWTPSRSNFLSNTDLIASQCLDPSGLSFVLIEVT